MHVKKPQGGLTHLLSCCLFAATATASGGIHGQEISPLTETTAGKIEFMSAARGTALVAVAKKEVRLTDKIFGYLDFPTARGVVPAVVLMHGSSGIAGGTTREWAALLNKLGVATFIVDSFEPRGISESASDQSQLSYTASGLDALNALKVVAKHPRIDSKRIGVMGFSRGGVATQNAGFELYRRSVISDDLKFAVHLALYGGCVNYGKTTGVPIIHMIGDKDDTANVNVCATYSKKMNEEGANIKLVIYPGARHGFDRKNQAPTAQRVLVTYGNCDRALNIDTQRYEVKGTAVSNAEFASYGAQCQGKGTFYQGDSGALRASQAEVTSAVERYLKP